MDFMDRVRSALSERVDGWVNLLTGVGTGRSKGLSFVQPDRLADAELEALFIGDPYANRICRVVPEEAIRQGYVIRCGDAAMETAIADMHRRWRTDERLAGAWTWARVFGGGAVFVGADDGQDPMMPLDTARIRSIRFLVTLDRRDLVPLTFISDKLAPNYGDPETFQLIRYAAGGAAANAIVHASRIVRFEGSLTTLRRRVQLRGWGESELQRLYDVLAKFNGSWEATGALLMEASQGVFKMKNLFAMMASDKRDVLKTRLEMMDLARSVSRSILVDADGESFERIEVGALTGLAQVLDKFLLMLAGAAEIPVTILMGQAPAGLSATGDSDVRWFYDRVKSAQASILGPRLLHLTRLMLAAHDSPTGGVVPSDLSVEFAPLWQMTPLEQATLRNQVAQTDTAYITAGVLTPEEVATSRFRDDGWSVETNVDLGVRRAAQAADEAATSGAAADAAPAVPTAA